MAGTTSTNMHRRLEIWARQGLVQEEAVRKLACLDERQLQVVCAVLFTDLIKLKAEDAEKIVEAAGRGEKAFIKTVRSVAYRLARDRSLCDAYLRTARVALNRYLEEVLRVVRRGGEEGRQYGSELMLRFLEEAIAPAVRMLLMIGSQLGAERKLHLRLKEKLML
ncbi:hypothetical protein [Thermosulfurimonas sp. F29]|uniref:hypothetical protein n=1 Tax=Thermosulfurimonas sp. F29 TaxID=2867247 RepID=UPI001C84013C|nr:hypothetical protein [Thermosulfurimonas sp. F29]MBX6423374.1 hypothetical protein [Thermosulfurimonas sp. F29]